MCIYIYLKIIFVLFALVLKMASLLEEICSSFLRSYKIDIHRMSRKGRVNIIKTSTLTQINNFFITEFAFSELQPFVFFKEIKKILCMLSTN